MARLEPAVQSGGLLKLYQALWAPLYAAVLNVLGSTGVVLPIGDPHHGQPNATTFTTKGEEQVTFTWSEAPGSFDTPLDLTDPDSFQGVIPVLTFNGTDEDATTPDAAYWSRPAGAFSMGMWVNLVDATSSALMARRISGSDLREWRWMLQSGDFVQLQLEDESESGNPNLLTQADATTPEGVWRFLAVTIDGSADATGLNLYADGVLVASSDTDNPNFVALEDLAQVTRLGSSESGGDYFDGKMAGGPLGPFFTQLALTADQVRALYDLGRAALAL